MKLFLGALDREVDELHRRGVRVRFIGERERFGAGLVSRMQLAEQRTADNTTLTLSIAASYGGRQDIARAARALAVEVAAGRLLPEQIDESLLGSQVALADLPAPDLFIRTGGDTRISNFLLWQLAYTELWFTEALWPDFDAELLQQALDAYASRERRFDPSTRRADHGAGGHCRDPAAADAMAGRRRCRRAADRPVGVAEAGRHRRHPGAHRAAGAEPAADGAAGVGRWQHAGAVPDHDTGRRRRPRGS
ncbi:hypothetical protein G6F31_015246 [Rhizopus arrhizus]|nr:hypothetical protein G6F31_015246 [Rhizopus arrhizus]